MIYLDNAATTLHKPDCVGEAIVNALHAFGNAGRGATTQSLDASRIIYETREKLAKLFGAENPTRIAFTMNSTESLNTAIKGCLSPGDHVISTMLEHNSVLRPLYEMEAQGVDLSFPSCDLMGRMGEVEFKEIEDLIKPNTKAIVCTHGSNLTGNIVDIEAVGKIAKAHNLLFIVDASQTAGVFPIDVEKMNIDILCFTGHKGLYGPQGTGGIYVREGVKVRPLKVGGSGIDTYNEKHPDKMPTALEAGTLNSHGIAGLHAALTFIEEIGIDAIREKEQQLMQKFYKGVVEIEGVKVYGDFSTYNRSPIVALNIGDYDSSEVSDELLMEYNISTRPGAHCAPLMHIALRTVEQGAVRFSFSYFNEVEEVEAAIEAVRELAVEE